MKGLLFFPLVVGLAAAAVAAGPDDGAATAPRRGWTDPERAVLRSLSLSTLPPLPPDPSNAHADDPRAVALGKRLFFDTRLSANGQVSCGTCHLPELSFTDRLPVARGMGVTTRRTMPLIGAAYQAWFFWDGRKDSLWSQALGPIENAAEHGLTRAACAHLVVDAYRSEYEEVFGPLPVLTREACPPEASPGTGDPEALRLWDAMASGDREAVNRVYANLGKAIAAFVRRILPTPARFDRYVDAVLRDETAEADALLNADEVEGLRLFLGKGQCRNCHSGPLFTNGSFHALGVPRVGEGDRATGVSLAHADEFNCLGKYSDAKPEQCGELRFADVDASGLAGAFKTPTLRNVAQRPPYMHAGQFASLGEVLRFYRGAASRELGHRELTDAELAKVESFLRTLSAPLAYP